MAAAAVGEVRGCLVDAFLLDVVVVALRGAAVGVAGVELAEFLIAAEGDDVGDVALADGVEAEGRHAGEAADALEAEPEGVDVETQAGVETAPEPDGFVGHEVEPHAEEIGCFVEEAKAHGAGFAAGGDVVDVAAVFEAAGTLEGVLDVDAAQLVELAAAGGGIDGEGEEGGVADVAGAVAAGGDEGGDGVDDSLEVVVGDSAGMDGIEGVVVALALEDDGGIGFGEACPDGPIPEGADGGFVAGKGADGETAFTQVVEVGGDVVAVDGGEIALCS